MSNATKFQFRVIIILAVIIVGFTFTQVYSDEPNNAPPSPKYKLSFTERFRIETWDNTTGLDNSAGAGTSYTRNRSTLMGQWFPKDKIELALKFANEFRSYFVPENKQFNIDELFIDQLYLKWKTIAAVPVTLTVGRQNIQFGEGFVIMDGGPLDGSRSAYFNAVRADYEIAPKKNLSTFYSVQNRHDDLLPIINNKNKLLNEQNEKSGAIYFSGDFGQRNLQAYFIRKDAKSATSPSYKTHINTIGERTVTPLCAKLSLTFEGAYQFGERGAADLSAYGGYAYLSYPLGWPKRYPLSFTLGTTYLSGDNPDTPKYEGWDPLYGRWPKWSDSYIYTLVKENSVAYWSNLFSLWGRAQIDIAKGVKFSFDYHHLMAPKNNATRLPFPGGTGKDRGELGIFKLTYQINKMVSGRMIWENFNPGSYYFPGADQANWMQIEFMMSL
jgi:hypothetical protein